MDWTENLKFVQSLSHALYGTSGVLGSPVRLHMDLALVLNREPDHAIPSKETGMDQIETPRIAWPPSHVLLWFVISDTPPCLRATGERVLALITNVTRIK